jgi:hypothetical protein
MSRFTPGLLKKAGLSEQEICKGTPGDFACKGNQGAGEKVRLLRHVLPDHVHSGHYQMLPLGQVDGLADLRVPSRVEVCISDDGKPTRHGKQIEHGWELRKIGDFRPVARETYGLAIGSNLVAETRDIQFTVRNHEVIHYVGVQRPGPVTCV